MSSGGGAPQATTSGGVAVTPTTPLILNAPSAASSVTLIPAAPINLATTGATAAVPQPQPATKPNVVLTTPTVPQPSAKVGVSTQPAPLKIPTIQRSPLLSPRAVVTTGGATTMTLVTTGGGVGGSVPRAVPLAHQIRGNATLPPGTHRLPASITPLPLNRAPLTSATAPVVAAGAKVVEAGGAKLTLVQQGGQATNLASVASNVRPLNASVSLSTGFPVTLRTPVVSSPSTAFPQTAAVRAPGAATIRQTIPFKPVAASSGAMTIRSPGEPSMKVTLLSSAQQASGTKVVVSSVATPVGMPAASPALLKTITTQPVQPRQLSPNTVRIGLPTSRMTVIPSAANTVTLGQINVPISHNVAAAATAASTAPTAQPMAAIIPTYTGGARLITVPRPNVSIGGLQGQQQPQQQQHILQTQTAGGVSIQKTVLTTLPQQTTAQPQLIQAVGHGGKTISLPLGGAPITLSKTVVAATSASSLPVARVTPQQPPQLPTQTGGLVISTSRPGAAAAALLPQAPTGGATIHRVVDDSAAAALQAVQLATQVANNRPGILRRRDGEAPGSPRPPVEDARMKAAGDVDDDGGSNSSGSTTLSATSCDNNNFDETNAASGGLQPSPRKKPRKQQLGSGLPDGAAAAAAAAGSRNFDVKRKIPLAASNGIKQEMGDDSKTGVNSTKQARSKYLRPEVATLLYSYRHTWKSRHNHFLRRGDVRVKEDKRPTVNELANDFRIEQKLEGWKVYHLTTQITDILEAENQLSGKLAELLKRLDKTSHRDISGGKDMSKVVELVKANQQRSKVFKESLDESKDHSQDIFEHKDQVRDIITKYKKKREIKKRELK